MRLAALATWVEGIGAPRMAPDGKPQTRGVRPEYPVSTVHTNGPTRHDRRGERLEPLRTHLVRETSIGVPAFGHLVSYVKLSRGTVTEPRRRLQKTAMEGVARMPTPARSGALPTDGYK